MQIPVTTSGRIHPYHPKMRPRLKPFQRKGHGLFEAARSLSLLVLAGLVATAQELPVLTNSGEPMRVSYGCVGEDLQWAGMTCGEGDPCPVYLELGSIASRDKQILVAGDLHSTSATLSSILLQSNDLGATWRETAARMRGAELDQLEVSDSQHAWVAGATQYPLTRDPFVLATTDSGATWKQSSIGEEGSAGSVQRFWFNSPQHGELIVDTGRPSAGGRYVSYESDNGGGTWTLVRAVGKLPELKSTAVVQEIPDWRIETGKDGKALQIEQRAGDRWWPVASFLIEVANCRNEAGQTKEPEPPGEPAAPKIKPNQN
jgi:hypothetical protein